MFKVIRKFPNVEIEIVQVDSTQTQYGLRQEVVANTEEGVSFFTTYVKENKKPLSVGINVCNVLVYSNNGKLGCSLEVV